MDGPDARPGVAVFAAPAGGHTGFVRAPSTDGEGAARMGAAQATVTTIDAKGMPRPGPLMSLIGAIRQARVGDVIEVISSDEGSRVDITAWVNKAGHELVAILPEGAATRFIARKSR